MHPGQAVGQAPGNVFGQGKNVPRIAMAHGIPYVATASVADLHDLETKVLTAMEIRGSRYLQGGGSADLSLVRSLGNRALVTLVRLLFRSSFSDLCYGYTAFWGRLLHVLQPDAPGFEIEAQLSVRALSRGLKVYEVPSYERVRIAGRSSLRPLRDGLRVLRTVLAERLRRQVRAPDEPSLEIPSWRR